MSKFKKIIKNKMFMGVFLIPFVSFSAYTLLLAQDRYVSNSSLVVQNIGGAVDVGGIGALLPGFTNQSTQDMMLIKEHIESADMLKSLDSEYKILDHWSSPKIDFIYSLWNKDYKDLAIDYYRKKVSPIFIPETGVLQVSVETFDPKVSKNVLDFILKKSEEFVNNNNHKAAKEQMDFVEREIESIKEKLDKSREELLKYQKETKFFSPEAEVAQSNTKIMILEENKIKAEAEFNAKKTFLQESSPKMVTLKNTIDHLDKQINIEKSKLVGKQGYGKGLNDYSDGYKMLEANLTLHTEEYRNALITYEKVKMEATRKLKQVVTVATPQLPDYPVYPNKKMNILYAFFILGLIYGLISLIKDVVKEHK